MKICIRCVLPETFPGVSFDEAGVCNFCRQFSLESGMEEKKYILRERFEELLSLIKRSHHYHCLVAFSGGKDSSITLKILRERYNLRMLAVTIDNGFTSRHAVSNIRQVVDVLDIDHIWVRPRLDLIRRLYAGLTHSKTLTLAEIRRASSICYACIGLVKSITMRIAIENNIPILVYGWSPGQTPVTSSFIQMNADFIRNIFNNRMQSLQSVAGEELSPYILHEEHFQKIKSSIYNISPLGFLDYDEERIFEVLGSIGWQKPPDTDGNSTNCLLNGYAIRRHLQEYGFHPYALEIANMVRHHYISRQEGLKKLADIGSEDLALVVEKRLTKGQINPCPPFEKRPFS